MIIESNKETTEIKIRANTKSEEIAQESAEKLEKINYEMLKTKEKEDEELKKLDTKELEITDLVKFTEELKKDRKNSTELICLTLSELKTKTEKKKKEKLNEVIEHGEKPYEVSENVGQALNEFSG